MPTVDDYLDQGWSAFEAALGSTPYDANVESKWRALFHDKVSWSLSSVASQLTYLLGLCSWMGTYAKGLPSVDGWVHLDQLIDAFVAVRAKGYHDNGDFPTRFC